MFVKKNYAHDDNKVKKPIFISKVKVKITHISQDHKVFDLGVTCKGIISKKKMHAKSFMVQQL